MKIKLEWIEFLQNALDKNMIDKIQWFLNNEQYRLFLFDKDLILTCTLDSDSPEAEQFEATYKTTTNMPLDPRDMDGASLQRTKVAPLGWMFQLHSVEFTTAKLDSLYNKDEMGNDLGFVALHLYDADDVEITTTENQGNAVKTIIHWEPNYTFEITGGNLFQGSPPTQDVRLWVIAVPDIPAQFGGDRDFIQGGVNLRRIMCSVIADGRVAKKLEYVEGLKLTKFEIVLKHAAGFQHSAQMLFEIFKQ